MLADQSTTTAYLVQDSDIDITQDVVKVIVHKWGKVVDSQWATHYYTILNLLF